MKNSKEIKEIESKAEEAGIEPKTLAERLKYLVDVEEKTGSEVVSILEDQTGLDVSKEVVHEFIFKYYKNPAGDFNKPGQERWAQ